MTDFTVNIVLQGASDTESQIICQKTEPPSTVENNLGLRKIKHMVICQLGQTTVIIYCHFLHGISRSLGLESDKAEGYVQ